MVQHAGAAIAGGLLASLSLMGASRKVLGPDVVGRRLVPHRGDIGSATFFSIGVGVCVELGYLSSEWAAGGAQHWMPAAVAQLGYLSSLIARRDLPPAHPHRLALLLAVWLGLAFGPAAVQIAVQVAALWIVKLRLAPEAPATGSADSQPSSSLSESSMISHLRMLARGVCAPPQAPRHHRYSTGNR